MTDTMIKTSHGEKRLAQIGITEKIAKVILNEISPRIHHDHLVYLVTNRAIERMLKNRVINVSEAKKMHQLMLIASTERFIITAYHPNKKKWKNMMRLPTVNSLRGRNIS